jgi:hypothetical protein
LISFEQFDRYIDLIRKDSDFIDKVTELFNTCFFIENFNSTGIAIELLEHLMNDTENGWISYWCWEGNFGRDDIVDSVTEADGTPIPLRTTRELYDFLCENAANKEAKCD